MSLQRTAALCTKCKEVLNSDDDIFGTSCGHLYHFFCLHDCQARRSPNCSHCDSYKPCMYRMFLEFGEPQPLSWEDQTKTIELLVELEDGKEAIAGLAEKYKISQLSVQQLEGKLKKLNDALNSKNATVAGLEERITVLENLNNYLSKENELAVKNYGGGSKSEENKIVNKLNIDYNSLTDQLQDEMNKNYQLLKENAKLKSMAKFAYDIENKEGHDGNVDNSKEGFGIVKNNDSNTICIKNFTLVDVEKFPLKSTIVYLAKKMGIPLSRRNVTDVFSIRSSSKRASLIVRFENTLFQEQFISKQKYLQNCKNTKDLIIQQYS